MKFIGAFFIVVMCLIPFLIGAGFGLNALLGYCSSDTNCHSREICNNNKCIDGCDRRVCGENEYCDVMNHHVLCTCQSGYLMNQITRRCEKRFYCINNSGCDFSSKCINNTCTSICPPNLCGPFEMCQAIGDAQKPKCICRSGYRRHPYNDKCVKRCIHNEDCEYEAACTNEGWCDTPCTGPVPLHSHCVPRRHEATYECDKCYHPVNNNQYCERDADDIGCPPGI